MEVMETYEIDNELVVELGDAAELTRGSGGSGGDDKRYVYN